MSTAREFQDGEVVAGTRYQVESQIGAGGMGSVYLVEHTELGKKFVLKALFRELATRKDLVARLRQEWRSLARLEHPNIINVTDAGTSSTGVPFYVMERLEGETLGDRLVREGQLPVEEALAITVGVLDGLAAAHQIGIVHRDIKPPNIYIVSGGAVKLLDFGVAKIVSSSAEVITARGMAIGTPRYMSPEQARGDRVDGRADLYAVGLMLFEMLTGVGPFDDAVDANQMLLAHLTQEAPRLSTRIANMPPELDDMVASLLHKEPSQRPATAGQVSAVLSGLLRRWVSVSTQAPTAEARYDAPTVEARASQADGTPLPPTAIDGAAGRRVVGGAQTLPASANLSNTLVMGEADTALSQGVAADPMGPTVMSAQLTSPAGPPSFQETVAPSTEPSAPPSFEASVSNTTLVDADPGPGSAAGPPSSWDRTVRLPEGEAPSLPGDEIRTHTSVPAVAAVRGAEQQVTPPPVITGVAAPAPKKSSAPLVIAAAAIGLLGLLGAIAVAVGLSRAESHPAPEAVSAAAEPSTVPAAAPAPTETAEPTSSPVAAAASAASASPKQSAAPAKSAPKPAESAPAAKVETPPAATAEKTSEPAAPEKPAAPPTAKPAPAKTAPPRQNKPALPASGL
ncbi:MAG: protein kinase [Myxococcales bacterium]|nr:protein kinase [Myxococcales bacterium]MCB9577474.1 protein kinase [Polyangiaceae bacterium]